jgi:cyclophilin family peptidyl-prolyl cis-trans isomerase/HEAT repeat protein
MKIAAAVCVALLLAQQQRLPINRAAAQDLVDQAQGGVTEAREVLNAEKAWAGADVLWPLALRDAATSYYAVRAIGRLEEPANVPRLLQLAQQPNSSPAVPAAAIAQSLNGFDPARDPQLMETVSTWLQGVTFIDTPKLKSVMPGPIASIRWGTAEQVHAAETELLRILTWSAYDKTKAGFYTGAVRGLETLARLNVRVTPFDPETITRLSRIVRNTGANDEDKAREAAIGALIAARALDAETELVALDDPYDQVRRLATAVLGGAGGGLDDTRRLDAIQEKLGDRHAQVRYEAVRAFARRNAPARGCGPLRDMLNDRDVSVALAAIDALGDVCKADDEITTRLAAEARVPPSWPWHREAHAFVALAKRSRERAAISMEGFVTHPSWWVRMYAAGAGAAADDAARLDKLAYDANDNVREAALGPLRRLKKEDADPAILAALERDDVQLLRTAATLLKTSPPSDRTGRALVAALLRLTRGGKETSRDARLPLLEAIEIHAAPDAAMALQPLLRDFDPQVAAKAAALVSRLTGKTAVAEPVPVIRGWAASFSDLRQCVTVSLESGTSFLLRMNPSAAPITVDRVLGLALKEHYYDGLTIHRIAPNFVIQGGSPGANEYAGHKEYMRDEIGARNSRGTVGLSTRGRNTADAQFYINLIDNARLDQDYTVFATVQPADMTAVDAIQEGDAIRRMAQIRCPVAR